MTKEAKAAEQYKGFEQGPIRPPSEARSLLLRISRNCPWNRCTFCPVYKGAKFSLRPVEHIIKDIDAVHKQVVALQSAADKNGGLSRENIHAVLACTDSKEVEAFHAALNWMYGGMSSIFIQDANSLIIKPGDLITVLKHLKLRFPWAERVTSYARSHTIAKIKDDELKEIADAGLNRIHIGLESASDKVLEFVKKGATKEMHINAGLKVKQAGMELSEYVMPGLGGVELSREHAIETADALNQINPDFIRLRSLAVPNRVELFEDLTSGRFEKCTDKMMAEEILLFLESLDGITSYIKSDHILNLFEEIDGKMPDDKDRMIGVVRNFLDMDPKLQTIFQVGRRIGVFSALSDMKDPDRMGRAENTIREYGITPDNVDSMIDEMMKRFI